MNTEMMNTRFSADAIQKMVAGNPCVRLESGDIRLPPARLSFTNLDKPGRNLNDPTKEGKYGANLVFPFAGADLLAPLVATRNDLLKATFPNNPTGAGMKNPFKNQAERVAPDKGGTNPAGKSFGGYVPGLVYISATGNQRPSMWKPPFVQGNPTAVITVEEINEAFYPGAWAIAVVRAYASKQSANPGVFFGLQSLFKLADDNKLGGGGGIDPKAAFGGIQIDNSVDAASLF